MFKRKYSRKIKRSFRRKRPMRKIVRKTIRKVKRRRFASSVKRIVNKMADTKHKLNTAIGNIEAG